MRGRIDVTANSCSDTTLSRVQNNRQGARITGFTRPQGRSATHRRLPEIAAASGCVDRGFYELGAMAGLVKRGNRARRGGGER